jgi:hypothetical protein
VTIMSDILVSSLMALIFLLFLSLSGAENGMSLKAGDSLLGDCKRDGCAEAIVQSLMNEDCKNVAFSIVSNEESSLTEQQWTKAFQKL